MQTASPNRPRGEKSVSIPERELLGFVSAVSELFGNGQGSFLREIWLDELASMETMPAPSSSEWRLVTLAAWARLAHRLADVPIMAALDRPAIAAHNGFFRVTDAEV